MSRCKNVIFFLATSHLITFAISIGISSNVDFGDSDKTRSLRASGTNYQVFTNSDVYNIKTKKEINLSDDVKGPDVTCGSNGCNFTETNNASSDVVKTDVIVHVETKVNLDNENKTKVPLDIPDVPIFLGVKGTDLDPEKGYNYGSPYDLASERGPNYSYGISSNPLYVTEGPSGKTNRHGSSFTAKTSILVNKENPITHRPVSKTPGIYSPYPRNNGENGIYKGGVNILANGINGVVPASTVNIQPLQPSGVRTGFSSYPTVVVAMTSQDNLNEIKYNSNDLQIQTVPYFEPAYHMHTYSEKPPPQLVWYPTVNTYNPVEFKNVNNPSWKPSTWQPSKNYPSYPNYQSPGYNYNPSTYRPSIGTKTEDCNCKDPESNHGLRQEGNHRLKWYPNRRLYTPQSEVKISDKLGSFD